ncbi:uncharacterized protein LOC127744948 isoform X2 [Arachis duranensis]|uniref:Uncharacterized protein LOC107477285 isoform X2 n=1 Tax=Arachis duranensis TaxID=130453 RepID=A0A9C6WL59_ARADU|nr:uncharacterized protein LOC107477285 isoform X2 [Arachis duranensis]XP_052113806.1 uncharacterized protein LOC127744948 isoform X2 [Arachis duranensis]
MLPHSSASFPSTTQFQPSFQHQANNAHSNHPRLVRKLIRATEKGKYNIGRKIWWPERRRQKKKNMMEKTLHNILLRIIPMLEGDVPYTIRICQLVPRMASL